MLGLDDEDTYLDISTYSPPLAQTASLGLKQSTVRWLPQAVHPVTGGALALAGSWDERTNELSAWSVLLAENDDSAMDGSAPAAPAAAQSVGAAPHEGCVLGLSVGEGGTHGTETRHDATIDQRRAVLSKELRTSSNSLQL